MPRPRPLRRALVSSLAALALTAAAAPAALAHATLVRSSPAAGQRLEQAPERVTLVFSEPLNPALSRAELLSSGGRRVAAGLRVVDRTWLVLEPRSPLAPGAYSVRWRSVSTTDAHPLEGWLGFGVRVEAGGAAGSLQSSPLSTGGWIRAPARAALYAALLLFCGGLLAAALLGAPNGGTWLVPTPLTQRAGELGLDVEAARSRSRALTLDSGLLAVGLAALVAAIESFAAAGGVSARALADFLLTGTAGTARVGVVAFAAIAVALRGRRRAGAVAAAAALACVTVSGHAASAQPRTAALAADYLHLLAGAVWLGGATTLVAVWWPGLRGAGPAPRREVARFVLPPFGVVALSAFVVVAVTGTLNAAIELGRLSALWDTAYGTVLAAKVVLVIALAALSYVHVRRLRPRLIAANPHPPPRAERAHWALLRAEAPLSLAIVTAAAALVVFPLPPRQLEAARGVAVTPCDPCPMPAPARGELAVAELGGWQLVAAWMRRTPDGVAGKIRLLDRRGRPTEGPVRVRAGTTAGCGPGCFRFEVRGRPEHLAVDAFDGPRRHPVTLPARWVPGQAGRARRLLERGQRTMRSLPSLREHERVTSGPGTLAVTEYRLRAPNRVAWATDGGVEAVQIGRGQWLRLPGEPWRRRDDLTGGVAFSTRSWFRWTPYARAVELLGIRRQGGRSIAEVAMMDPGTPVWARLSIDLATGRVLEERLVARSRRVTHRFFDFGGPVTIQPPLAGR